MKRRFPFGASKSSVSKRPARASSSCKASTSPTQMLGRFCGTRPPKQWKAFDSRSGGFKSQTGTGLGHGFFGGRCFFLNDQREGGSAYFWMFEIAVVSFYLPDWGVLSLGF